MWKMDAMETAAPTYACTGSVYEAKKLQRAVPGHSGGALSVCFPKFSSIQCFPLFGFSKFWLSAVPCCYSFPIWATFVFCLLSQLQCVLSPNPWFSLFISRLYHTQSYHPSSCILLIPDPAHRRTTSDQPIQFHYSLCVWKGCLPSKLFFMGFLQPRLALHKELILPVWLHISDSWFLSDVEPADASCCLNTGLRACEVGWWQ